MPDIIQHLKDAYSENPAKALELLPELFKQYNDGKIVNVNEQLALAMDAGARTINQGKQGKYGMIYVRDIFGECKEIPYCIAAKRLEESAEKALEDKNETDII